MPQVQGFVGGSYIGQSLFAAGHRTINMVPEIVPEGGKTRAALYPAPGYALFATTPKAPGRGMYYENDRLWAVGGNQLCEVSAAGVVTARGDLLADANPAQLSSNGDVGDELLVSSGGRGDILVLSTNTFLPGEVADVHFSSQLDGFFFGLDTATSTLKASRATDGQTWDATDVVRRTSAPDRWRAMIASRRELFLFGGKTGEVFTNRGGGTGFPYRKRTGADFQNGIIAPYSLCLFGDSIAWLGRTSNGAGAVYWMSGYTPEEISTPAVQWAIQEYEDNGDIDDAIGWSYEREGHKYYVLTFPDAGKTWVYDSTTEVWHERGFWDTHAADYMAYRGQFHANAFGRNLVQDRESGNIYALSSKVFVDVDGRGIRRSRRMPHVHSDDKLLYFSKMTLGCDRGVGDVDPASQGYDPVVNLTASNDGGHRWGADRSRRIGTQGARNVRVRWNQGGRSRDRVWELWSADPVAHRWLGFSSMVKHR